MSSPPIHIGQVLRGRLGNYAIAMKIQETVWFAKSHNDSQVIVKSVTGHLGIENEQDVLKRFRSRAPYRPLIDEIEDPAQPTTIVLKHLDDQLLDASVKKTLNRKEIKYVSRRVLEALSILHKDGYVHTDVKLDNIFINYEEDDGNDDVRFSDVELGDFETLMDLPWNTATNIWSFGTSDFNIFRPKTARPKDEDYRLEMLKSQFRYFGPWPGKIREILDEVTIMSLLKFLGLIPPSTMSPFRYVTEREVVKEDKEFIPKIMQMDWRDRPAAKQLLEDKWFLA
ncbi:serine/threonine protein kinase [Podospora didyma]|uniref:non-specific serine/threonine protein kinase n=1 Tax=Podospora didyma TaxID=330526 RepID=A0AAE0KEB8_9PEZI|nr:serine/threonine protein kinase [Podospora didyma]